MQQEATLYFQNTPMYTRIACFVSCLLLTSTATAQPQLSGYLEPSYRIFEVNRRALTQLENRLRADLQDSVASDISLDADVVFEAYQGTRTLPLDAFLPGQYAFFAQLLPPVQFTDRVYVDNAYVSFSRSGFDLRGGRQPLFYGVAYLYNPVDLTNVKATFDPTYDKPGKDAMRAVWFYRGSGSLELTGLVADETRRWGGVARWADRLLGADVSLLGATRLDTLAVIPERHWLAGTTLEGTLLGLGAWAEAAYNWMDSTRNFARFAIGGDYTFDNGLYVIGEYYYDELGRTRKEDYQLTDWLRVLSRGGSLGRDRLFLGTSYPFTGLWRGALYGIANLDDRSFALNPWIYWSARQDLEINLSAALPWGRSNSEFGTATKAGFVRVRAYF